MNHWDILLKVYNLPKLHKYTLRFFRYANTVSKGDLLLMRLGNIWGLIWKIFMLGGFVTLFEIETDYSYLRSYYCLNLSSNQNTLELCWLLFVFKLYVVYDWVNIMKQLCLFSFSFPKLVALSSFVRSICGKVLDWNSRFLQI